ncbi:MULTISPECIES: DUF3987 domain-containing protein [unclassified Polaribacter]|jgi:hypothetical protein|uniref:DUF3987 domain-containing protein n=1 Tax=unclassified Polaribacter TaxID=196858 RepID=UPI001C4E34A5|nr:MULTISPECIES: DUF3987 domain-containing protein [unclassified Polaribacter]QXP63925.1 DUF3987 domain-containing protein [Polaribacter sp. HaHaR_3_91]QXP66425.1 DUF3987 domain-containing protein [Polaribacter sp. AHE13PA]
MFNSELEIQENLNKLTKTNKDILRDNLEVIISKLPLSLSSLIENGFKYKRIPKEYLLSSVLFAFSAATGRTFYIDTLGYKNYANLYFVIIGSRGDVKSEAIKTATAPIKKTDDKDYESYLYENKDLGKEDKVIKRRQTLIQNATIEAAQKIHFENPNSIGLCLDEIYGLVQKMANSNSRDGVEWRNFFLEGYTNDYIDVSRKTTVSFRIPESYPTLIGGLQYQFVKELFANGNLESGFIDRLLFTTKLTENKKLRKEGIPYDCIERYSQSIKNLLDYKKQSENPEELRKQFKISFTKEAELRLFNYVQKLIEDKDVAKPMIKEYLSKMQISIHKFCLLSFMMLNASESTFNSELTVESVELAIALNDFYFLNFQVIIEDAIKDVQKKISIEDVVAMGKKNGASQKAVTEVAGVHKSTISRLWKNV